MIWLRLIRWQNLLIILGTQFAAWFCVIRPNDPVCLDLPGFSFLSFSTICIAAAGYIINDYFDIRIDALNRPEKMILGKFIPRRTAIIAHSVLNVAGIVTGLIVCMRLHNWWPISVQLFCTLLLWSYSSRFKRAYMIGNIVVSVLTAMTIVTLLLYEPRMMVAARLPVLYGRINQSALPFWMLSGYAWFAFLLNWMREIVKDMEDFSGDAQEGCETMPILKGMAFSTRFIMALAVVAVASLCMLVYILCVRQHYWFASYLAGFLITPLVWWSVWLRSAYTTLHFHSASHLLKWIMVPGILSLFVYYLHL